jgi:hypothetical protein
MDHIAGEGGAASVVEGGEHAAGEDAMESSEWSSEQVVLALSADAGRVRLRLLDDRPEAIPADPAALARLLAALDELGDALCFPA